MIGVPARYLFVTSTETNELRILENYRTGLNGPGFVRAPNPLETLSIPVLDRPTMLVADEGRNSEGSRVTGAYVYAARPGAAEVSVVSVANRTQLGGRPMATPGPVTALGAFMDVDAVDQDLTTSEPENLLPATTRLFVATWDGEFASVYSAVLPTDSRPLDHLDFKRLVLIDQTPVTALLVVAPLSSRTLDGAPFCSTKACLALSTRQDSGSGGQTMLLDPETGISARLAFKGPVRELTNSTNAARIYGVLDEQACGGPACGGVAAVDLTTATSAAGFPAALDALGQPMVPLRSDGLITGLTVAAGGTVRQAIETGITDGGTLSYVLQQYQELGAFSSSNGLITYFSGFGGSIIDFDGRRTVVGSATVRLPGLLPDGGEALFGDDGGILGSNTAATVVVGGDLSQTWRTATVTTAEATEWNARYLGRLPRHPVDRHRLPGPDPGADLAAHHRDGRDAPADRRVGESAPRSATSSASRRATTPTATASAAAADRHHRRRLPRGRRGARGLRGAGALLGARRRPQAAGRRRRSGGLHGPLGAR